MNAIIEVNVNNPQSQAFLQYARSLPFTNIVEKARKMTHFEMAVAECDARPASEFFDALREQVKSYYRNA